MMNAASMILSSVRSGIAYAMALILLCAGLSSCSKDVLGVTDPAGIRSPGAVVVIKRSDQETYNAKRSIGTNEVTTDPTSGGIGSIGLVHQDLYFNEAGGEASDVVRPLREGNLLLVSLSMLYQRPGKEGLQDFGASATVHFNGIELHSAARYTSASLQRGAFKRSFAFTRGADGRMTGAAGYEGSGEVYDSTLLDFSASSPEFTITGSDVVADVRRDLRMRPAVSFDSGTVFLSTQDAVLHLNRPLQKGSILSFQRLRGPASPYPYIPSVVSYELLSDTNAIRIPAEEVRYIIDVLRFSTGIPKVFGVPYPVWVSVIESGTPDTLSIPHAVTGAPFRFVVHQYMEFGRKVYFK